MSGLSIVLRSCLDALRPRFLGLTLLALLAACVLWVFILVLALNPLIDWATAVLAGLEPGAENGAMQAFVGGWLVLLQWLFVPMLVFGLLWPLVAASAVLFAGLVAMPRVLKFLAQGEFADVAWRGQSPWWEGIWVGIKASLVYVLLWLLSIPLWLIPGLFFVIPMLLTVHLLIKVMSFDALSEVATPEEMRVLQGQRGATLWSLGLICTVFSCIPPILLLMPVVCSLVFARHYLQGLRQLRAKTPLQNPQWQAQPQSQFHGLQ